MFDVITIGSATRDAFFKVDFERISWPKTPSGRGYILPVGEKLEVRDIFFTIGGNAVNASVTFGRQGFKTACVAKTGQDVSGEELRRRLKKEGVDAAMMVSHQTLPTAYSVLLLEKGERTILGYHGASDSFTIKDVCLGNMLSRFWYLSLAGESHKMFKKLLSFAREKGIAVAFNPSGHHIKHARGDILSSLKDISVLFVNDEEASLLTGINFKKGEKVFKSLDRAMPGILAVTMGRRGVVVSDGKFVYKAGIFREKKLVDRTGAGDAFGAGFTAALLRRGVNRLNIKKVKPEDVEYAIRLATANAASVVERLGATEGILTKKEFERSERWARLPIQRRKI